MDAEELLKRYAAGERDFAGIDLSSVDLREAELTRISLVGTKSRSQSLTGNAGLEAPPPLLAALPPGATFPASGWKRDLKGLLA
ncbi:hypothetical protein [Nostoc sp.]|uniref:hypothetical protein n=1 Tax=Nostoc sp. TaxID=1180 RepID=UPI002FF8CA0D